MLCLELIFREATAVGTIQMNIDIQTDDFDNQLVQITIGTVRLTLLTCQRDSEVIPSITNNVAPLPDFRLEMGERRSLEQF